MYTIYYVRYASIFDESGRHIESFEDFQEALETYKRLDSDGKVKYLGASWLAEVDDVMATEILGIFNRRV